MNSIPESGQRLSLNPCRRLFQQLFTLTVILLFSSSAFAQASDPKVNIHAKNLNIKEFLNLIEQQAPYTFVYRNIILDDRKDITIDATDKPLFDLLKQVLYDKELDFKIANKTIVLLKREQSPGQNGKRKKISGVIKDKTGDPLLGVSISLKGSSTGTITDTNGNFSLDAADNSVLVVSYVGYRMQEVAVKGNSSLDIVLEEDTQLLEEVVVVGYGTVKKRDHTGSLGSVDSDKLRETNKTSIGGALQGKLAGVDIIKSNNKPGAGFDIMVRGQNKITSAPDLDNTTAMNNVNPPLYVVDGMFVNSISDISPDDIDRIDVLKDASSTAIYGSRGANGVVIISTKRGAEGRSFVEYNGTLNIGRAMNQPDFQDGEGYAQYRIDRYKGENWKDKNLQIDLKKLLGDQSYNNYNNKKYTDWVDQILDTSISHSHSARVYGSAQGLAYTFGVNYTNEDGVVGIDGYERYNVSVSVDKKLNKYLKTGVNLYSAYEVTQNSGQEVFRSAYRLNPLTDIYNEDNSLKLYPDDLNKNIANPLLEIDNTNIEKKRIHVFGNLYLEYKPLSWLKLTTTFTPDIAFMRNGEYRGKDTKSSKGEQVQTRAYYSTDNRVKYTWDNLINAEHTFNLDHTVGAMLGSSWYKDMFEESATRADGMPTDYYQWYNMAAGTMKEMKTNYVQEQLMSFFARVNYGYKDRYLVTVTGRSDGSSRLAKGHRWSFFPSAALGWRVSEEAFLKDRFKALSDLKLRLSYGVSGNNSVRPYESIVTIQNNNYLFGEAPALGAYLTKMRNVTLTWEKTNELNLGVDFSFFRSRLSGTLDLYNRRTKNLLMYKSFSVINGFDGRTENTSVVNNKGIELTLNSVNIRTRNFTWSTSINFTTNHNEIKDLNGGYKEDKGNGWFVGESVGAVYTYKPIGIWQESEEAEAARYGKVPGSIKYLDRNGDYSYTDNADKMVLGSIFPKWTGGINNTFKYKDIDFSFFISTRQGQYSFSQFHKSFGMGDNQYLNVLKLNYWTPENPEGTWFRPGVERTDNLTTPFPFYYMKTSYVKVNNINLGYNLPADLLRKAGITKLRVYASLQNPFVFTDYDGWDPETASENSYTQSAMVRSLLFGVNLTF